LDIEKYLYKYKYTKKLLRIPRYVLKSIFKLCMN